jgi:hypothetical protein
LCKKLEAEVCAEKPLDLCPAKNSQAIDARHLPPDIEGPNKNHAKPLASSQDLLLTLCTGYVCDAQKHTSLNPATVVT